MNVALSKSFIYRRNDKQYINFILFINKKTIAKAFNSFDKGIAFFHEMVYEDDEYETMYL